MSDMPERIWLDWPGAKHGEPIYTEPPERDTQAGQTEYVRADLALPAVQPDAAALIRWHDMLLRDFGDDLSSIVRAEMLAMLDKPAVQPHVTETPKSEHEGADMLKLSVQGKAREAALREAAAACIWDDGDASRAAILALIDKPAHD